MADRQTTWSSGQTLTHTDLNNEFNEIFTNITDGNVASGAAIDISKIDGYTPWTTWSPTVSTDGSGTYTASVAVNQKSRWRYMILGKTLFLNCAERFNLTVASSAYLDITLPSGVTIPADDAADTMPSGQMTGIYFDGSTRTGPLNVRAASPSGTSFESVRIFRLDDAGTTLDWSVNNGSNFRFSFVHEID